MYKTGHPLRYLPSSGDLRFLKQQHFDIIIQRLHGRIVEIRTCIYNNNQLRLPPPIKKSVTFIPNVDTISIT